MNHSLKNLTLSAIFMAVGIILPFFMGHIPQIGNMLLPMHIPVILCGLICGWSRIYFTTFSFAALWNACAFSNGCIYGL